MNETIRQLLNRRSIRKFTDDEVCAEHLNYMLNAARQAPNSVNGQQISLVKPRILLESYAMFGQYDAAAVKKGVEEYENTLRKWWDTKGMVDMPSYKLSTEKYYSSVYFPHTGHCLEDQGFAFDGNPCEG